MHQERAQLEQIKQPTVQLFESPRLTVEVRTDPNPATGISGHSSVLSDNEIVDPLWEALQNSTRCQENVTLGISFSEGNSMVCRGRQLLLESYPTSPIALQSSPDANELHTFPELQSGGNIGQVQHGTSIECSQQRGSEMPAKRIWDGGKTSQRLQWEHWFTHQTHQ